ncbi:MAG: type II toxin-antitoxin system VapC family toxin [Acidobacteria bacterium]|nr:type II toxin-antitoxin system VapC family toxin [Acidobacteriota bacterium]
MRAFLDANVLFSASNAGSNIARLIALLTERETGVTSDVAVAEAGRNLALKRAAWRPALESLLADLEIVPSARFDLPVSLDTADASLLCAAIRSRCAYFVTGDKRDVGHLYNQTVQGVEVISLLRLADVLSSGSCQGEREKPERPIHRPTGAQSPKP